MAIIENKSTEIGDVIVIKSEVPIIGLIALQDFYDSTLGEDGNKYFERKFRYSVDGINYSLWIELTTANISSIEVAPTSVFFIEYTYTRIGTDPTGDLTFISTSLNAQQIDITCGNIYQDSIFAQFFSCYDIGIMRWCINVTEKLYKPGIVPNYIERGNSGNFNNVDEDYIAFWRAVACMFAIIVNYARVFEDFTSYSKVFKEYLKQKGLYFCSEQDIEDLNYIMQNFYSEMAFRGGRQMILRKGEEGKVVDGELLRLICIKNCTEFLFTLTDNWKVGWNIGNASPLYRGTYFQDQLIKGYEKTQDVEDLSNYPLINPTFVHHHNDNDSDSDSNSISDESFSASLSLVDNEEVMFIEKVPYGQVAGIGLSDALNPTHKITVNSRLDYEITFMVKQSYLAPNVGEAISFGCYLYDSDNNQINLLNVEFGYDSFFFFEQKKLNKSDHYYFIRGIIYSRDQDLLSTQDAKLNIGYGTNLKFPEIDNICSIVPYLVLDNSKKVSIFSYNEPSNEMYIWDFKVRPLRTDYSTGFIQLGNFIQTWLKNNSTSYSNQNIEDIMKEYLIPYDCALKINNLN